MHRFSFHGRVSAIVVAVCWVSANPARAGYVAYWRFGEGVASTAASGADSVLDSSGHGLNGTPFNGPIYRSNVPVNPIPQTGATNALSLEFNANSTGRAGNQRIFVADDPPLQLTHSLTLEAYVNLASFPAIPTDEEEIVFRGDDRGGLDPYFLEIRGQNLLFSIDSGHGGAFVSAPFPGLNQWVHVAGTLDDATGAMKLYIDGTLAASAVSSLRPFAALDPTQEPGLGIGATQSAPFAQYFHGLIDEVRISDEALSPDQFLDAPAAVPEPSSFALCGIGGSVLLAWGGWGARKRRT